jgi:ABC-type glycerol-3-phosphate transport system substrate-binding protein
MRRSLAIAAALTLGLSACGAAPSKPETEQQKVTKVVDTLASAGSRHDAKQICTEILAKQLDRAIKDATDYDLQVVSVKVNGSNATAQVRQGDKGSVATFTFVKEGGAWKASALGA